MIQTRLGRRYFLSLVGMCMCAMSSGADDGSLSKELIAEIQNNFKMDTKTKLVQNAVTNNNIDKLALNRGIVRGHNGHFTHKINFKDITNQKASGRCWIFAGLNTMRPKAMKAKNLEKIQFSAAYLHFWDKLEKSNLYLEYMIEMRETDYLDREWELVQEWTLGDGGWWNFVVDLVEKYGVVPQDVMPETHSSENTRRMNTILEKKLRHDAVHLHEMHRKGASLEALRQYKRDALADVYRILVINLGEPPRKFEWRYEAKPEEKEGDNTKGVELKKKDEDESTKNDKLTSTGMITPQQFYKEFVDMPIKDYVCLYNDHNNPFMKHYRFKRSTNMAGKKDMDFVNLPIDQLKQIAMKSVIANQPVWFAADVSKGHSSELGLFAKDLYEYGPLFGVDLSITKANRVKYRAGASNHAMVFMGVDVQDNKPVKWLVENSWGTKNGDNGKWTMYDGWFNEHLYLVIVHKDHVPADILKVFEQPAKQLPAWYPGAQGIK